MGEAIHLSRSERVKLIKVARKELNNARETLELTLQAAYAGADYAIVVAGGYFAGALVNDREVLKALYAEVADRSLIPVMIYDCTFITSISHYQR